MCKSLRRSRWAECWQRGRASYISRSGPGLVAGLETLLKWRTPAEHLFIVLPAEPKVTPPLVGCLLSSSCPVLGS